MEFSLKDTLNSGWKNDKTGFGFKMLQKMGWQEDTGLGKNRDGVVTAVKVKKREDGLGLGMSIDKAGNTGWGATATSFNEVLDMLKVTYAKDVKKSTKKSKSNPKIQVGIKYHKLSASKDLTNKSDYDLTAILGHERKNKINNNNNQKDILSSDSEKDNRESEEERKRRKSKKKRKSMKIENSRESNNITENKRERDKKKRKESSITDTLKRKKRKKECDEPECI
mmetsp:Transcript_17419/g.17504  ORF Transcript_17419/g.17504 Transcript_17419/m.17504 type:complete len:225 (-) Transcript_17419:7-681(-)